MRVGAALMAEVKTEITIGNVLSIVTTLLSIMGGVWWMSDQLAQLRAHDQVLDASISDLRTTDARVLGERDIRRKAVDEKIEFLFNERQRMTRLETQMDFLVQSVKRIEVKLDRAEEAKH